MRWIARLLVLLVAAALAGLAWVWIAQNTDQTATLSLDLTSAVGAWQTRGPVPVTTLMIQAFAAGFVVAGLMFLLRGIFSGSSQASGDSLG